MNQITHHLNAGEQDQLRQAVAEMAEKYLDLVWYARSNPATDTEYWSTVPAEIRQGAFEAQSKVEEERHEDVIELRECEDNWQHGFNSGCLAAFRLVLSALHPTLIIDPAFDGAGEPCQVDGLQAGLDDFPMLDT